MLWDYQLMHRLKCSTCSTLEIYIYIQAIKQVNQFIINASINQSAGLRNHQNAQNANLKIFLIFISIRK